MKLEIFVKYFVIVFLIYLLIKNSSNKPVIEGFTQEYKQSLFDNFLENHYSNIFPDGGRNSGGPMFYKYITDNVNTLVKNIGIQGESQGLDKEHFQLYNQFYCGVSGSIVSPNRSGGNTSNNIVLKDLQGVEYIGKYYRCCVPCLCDLMRYSLLEIHSINLPNDPNPYQHFVITVPDPCINMEQIPSQVTAYNCSNNLTENGVRTNSGRLIVATLFGPEINGIIYPEPILYDSNIHTVDGDQFCNQRICQPPDQLRGGMGDIFVLLSLVGRSETEPPSPPERFSCENTPMNNISDTHDSMVNIYGEPLEKCKGHTNDNSGSWDSQGFCSELGGGVHQICMNVNDDTLEVSSQTGQSDWSYDRYGKNHCMCIGAWALYKAKQGVGQIENTFNELVCEAIPKVSLTDTYLNNWATWNGNELSGQIVHGVNKLVEQCYENAETQEQKQHLVNLYNNLTINNPEFNESNLSFDNP